MLRPYGCAKKVKSCKAADHAVMEMIHLVGLKVTGRSIGNAVQAGLSNRFWLQKE
jgi:hypothetical protein